ncbi:hypothetical protein OBCHQ24_07260 [Oceanobacillus iheyensis]|nr:hypothetical protein OBCHQ24_07260 [Oceanobacillus iheyensis]
MNQLSADPVRKLIGISLWIGVLYITVRVFLFFPIEEYYEKKLYLVKRRFAIMSEKKGMVTYDFF